MPVAHISCKKVGWVEGWVDGWMDGWVGGKAGLRIAYSNQKSITQAQFVQAYCKTFYCFS